MGRDRISKRKRQFLERYHEGFELVGDAEEARLLAALDKRPNKLTWQRRYNPLEPHDTGRFTPFGWLEVRSAGGGFQAYRNDDPLCHATCRAQPGRERTRWPSLFVTRAAAQAAAELHLALGWGDYAREPDCLSFDWRTWERLPGVARDVRASDISDDHRFGVEELKHLCHPWGYPFERSNTAKELHRGEVLRERWAPFRGQPVWQRDTQGWYSLKTPYGELVVRRENNGGWVLERNGRALHYMFAEAGVPHRKVVFDTYLDAQTRALMQVYDLDKQQLLHWHKPKTELAAA